ncbi:hypothetical protein HGRIS_005544 [Hohenbuehelia grisea]|uniref:Uncharacterized protein n=1 Tax=Hohenbuehelia grisea TaxID=104357 RepID=A0ABR3JZH6_9AGAR
MRGDFRKLIEGCLVACRGTKARATYIVSVESFLKRRRTFSKPSAKPAPLAFLERTEVTAPTFTSTVDQACTSAMTNVDVRGGGNKPPRYHFLRFLLSPLQTEKCFRSPGRV